MNNLDEIAHNYGLKRKRYFLIFKESNKSLRSRIINFFYDYNNSNYVSINSKIYQEYEMLCRTPTPKIDFKEIWNWLKQLVG